MGHTESLGPALRVIVVVAAAAAGVVVLPLQERRGKETLRSCSAISLPARTSGQSREITLLCLAMPTSRFLLPRSSLLLEKVLCCATDEEVVLPRLAGVRRVKPPLLFGDEESASLVNNTCG